ncbi:MAG: histidine phosphatase family protein [Clostridia bacterium]|nr:histidine phosphatase family protein [Clostridia bacterium]
MLFFYVRHGDPIYDPGSLTPLGERQAEAVARRLALFGIDEIYSSTSNRAILTATPTAELCKKEIKQLDFANESHAWETLTFNAKNPPRKTFLFHAEEVQDAFHGKEVFDLGYEWYKHPLFEGYPYKEGIDRVRAASDEFFESLGYKHEGYGKYKVIAHNNKRVAMFAHQGFGMAFIPTVLGIPYPLFATHFDFSHSSVTVIQFDEVDGYAYPRVLTLSNDSHLYRDGLPTRYNGSSTRF